MDGLAYCRAVHGTALRPEQVVPRLDADQWWLVAVVWFGIGDLVTTGVGLGHQGVVEANPVVVPLLATASLVALVGLKCAVIGGCYLLSKQGPAAVGVGVPVCLATLGALVTAWNLHVLLSVGLR